MKTNIVKWWNTHYTRVQSLIWIQCDFPSLNQEIEEGKLKETLHKESVVIACTNILTIHMLFMRAHKDVTVIPRLVLSHSTAMPSSLSAVQLHGYTPAIISKIYYQSGSKNIIYVRERYLTEFWAQEVWRLLVLSESWHSWHYHKQTWGKKTGKLTHKNIFISNTIQIEPRTHWQHY